MKGSTKAVARFALLTALALVLGYMDRAIPISAILGGAVPGIKLGLANTVLLYAVYIMDWKASVVLMLAKVLLSGFMYGSMSAIIYSLSGGVLSLAAMLVVKRSPKTGFLVLAAVMGTAAFLLAFVRKVRFSSELFPYLAGSCILCALAIVLFFVLRKNNALDVVVVSMIGAVAHNVGQIISAYCVRVQS